MTTYPQCTGTNPIPSKNLKKKIPIPSKRCSFSLDQVINAPLHLVWSIVRQFHNPKAYKIFIKSCLASSASTSTSSSKTSHMITYVTGFPARMSIERLDELDDDKQVLTFSIVGGDHGRRLVNYQGMISVNEEGKQIDDKKKRTVVTEKYSVDVPGDSNEEDTRLFVDTLVGLNLKSLARVAEGMI